MTLVIERLSLMVYGHGWEYVTLKPSYLDSIGENCPVSAIADRFDAPRQALVIPYGCSSDQVQGFNCINFYNVRVFDFCLD